MFPRSPSRTCKPQPHDSHGRQQTQTQIEKEQKEGPFLTRSQKTGPKPRQTFRRESGPASGGGVSWCLGLPPRSGGCHSCRGSGLGRGPSRSLCPCFIPGAPGPGLRERHSLPASARRWVAEPPSSSPLERKYVKDTDVTLGVTFSML